MEKTVTIPLVEYLHLVEFKKNIKKGKCVRVVGGYRDENPNFSEAIIFYNVNEAIEEIAEINKHLVTNYNQKVFKEEFQRTRYDFVKLKCEYEKLKYDHEKLKKEYEHQKNKSLFERIFNK